MNALYISENSAVKCVCDIPAGKWMDTAVLYARHLFVRENNVWDDERSFCFFFRAFLNSSAEQIKNIFSAPVRKSPDSPVVPAAPMIASYHIDTTGLDLTMDTGGAVWPYGRMVGTSEHTHIFSRALPLAAPTNRRPTDEGPPDKIK